MACLYSDKALKFVKKWFLKFNFKFNCIKRARTSTKACTVIGEKKDRKWGKEDMLRFTIHFEDIVHNLCFIVKILLSMFCNSYFILRIYYNSYFVFYVYLYLLIYRVQFTFNIFNI